MSKIFLIFSLTTLSLLSVNTNSCNKEKKVEFEGKITFENTTVTGKDIDRDANYHGLFGETDILTYSNGNYTIEYPNGDKFIQVLYNNESNNYYMYYKDGSIKYFNALNESDKIVNITRNSKKIMICGYNCESIKFDFGRFAMTYFYSKELPVNFELFKNHHYNFFNKFYEESKSICLKTIMEYEDMKYIKTAIKVEKVKINKKQFDNPENAEKYQKGK